MQIKLRASGIRAYKACPRRYQLGTVEGLAPAQESDSARMGTVWHALHEVYYRALRSAQETQFAADHLGETLHDPVTWAQVRPVEPWVEAKEEALAWLGERYRLVPHFKTPDEWRLEQTILSTCFVGYLWYFSDDPIDVLQSEWHWTLPLHHPGTGRSLPQKFVVREGTIDHIIRWRNMIGTVERKSTSKNVAPDSDYWTPLKKDTQVSMYALAFRDLRHMPPDQLEVLDPRVRQAILEGTAAGNTLYDVWHRPTIKPSMLTQKETAAFLADPQHAYCGISFDVEQAGADPGIFLVGGEPADGEVGKSGNLAIRETLGMFAARLLHDITERPEHYFQRQEITRTEQDLQQFRVDLYNIYQSIRSSAKLDSWFENEQQCRATFPCPFIGICYGPGAKAVADGVTTPDGYVRVADAAATIDAETPA